MLGCALANLPIYIEAAEHYSNCNDYNILYYFPILIDTWVIVMITTSYINFLFYNMPPQVEGGGSTRSLNRKEVKDATGSGHVQSDNPLQHA